MNTATVRFSLGSLNLHCGRDHHGWPFDVTAAIHALDTDVVALQENWRPDGSVSIITDVATELGYDKPIELDVFHDTNLRTLGIVSDTAFDEPGTAGLALLSRVPLSIVDQVRLGHAPRDGGMRMAQVAIVGDPTGPTVRLVNTHLTHRLQYGPAQLRRLVAAVPAAAGPTVMAGDFNMFRPTVRLATGYRGAVRGRTWPAIRPAFQIDHVLVGPGIEFGAAQVLATVGSDHRPVRVMLGRTP